MRIPDGYVLVPVEPTEVMLIAGSDQEWTEDVYAAMVEAAPVVEVDAYDEAKERELFEISACHRILADDPDCDITVNEIFESRRGDEYQSSIWSFAWWSWQACAKSRSGTAS